MNCSPRVVFIFSYSLLQNVVSKSALQFKGNSQHDAQEFLLWLLDRVHEDLNRIIHPESKPPRKVNSKVVFIPCSPWIIMWTTTWKNHITSIEILVAKTQNRKMRKPRPKNRNTERSYYVAVAYIIINVSKNKPITTFRKYVLSHSNNVQYKIKYNSK